MEQTLTLCMGKPLSRKPETSEEKRLIASTIARCVEEAITADELREGIEAGRTILPALMLGNRRSNENWREQQLFGIDFDDNSITPDQALARLEQYQINPLLAYWTFSGYPRFRVLIASAEPFRQEEATTAQNVRKALVELFAGAADNSCKDAARLFYGSTKGSVFYPAPGQDYHTTEKAALVELIQATRELPQEAPQEAKPATKNAAGNGYAQLDQDELLRLLGAFDPNCKYDEWLKTGMALKAGGYSVEVWNDWSSAGGNYPGTAAIQKKWDSFKRGTGVTMGTLFWRYAVKTGHSFFEHSPILDNAVFKPSDYSEAGNAQKIVELFGGSMQYCDAIGWLAWDGSRWDHAGYLAEKQVQTLSQMMLNEAADLYSENLKRTGADTPALKQYLKHAQQFRNARTISNSMGLAVPFMAIHSAALDADPAILNTPAGIVDLTTGGMKPHDPNKFCTKITPVEPSPEISPESPWLAFVDMVTCGDHELAHYLQVAIGATIYGKTLEKLFIANGAGRNGKSTFYNALIRVLGDYAGTVDSALITTDREKKGPLLATLRGKRLITMNELEDGATLSEKDLRSIASTDAISAEQKYKAPAEFTPTHNAHLLTNFLPRVTGSTLGTWRRIAVIPFHATMPEGDAEIKDYASILADSCGGDILKWAIDGAAEYMRRGEHLPYSAAVEKSTSFYKSNEDGISLFIAEYCNTDIPSVLVSGAALYAKYMQFSEDAGYRSIKQRAFYNELETRGFHRCYGHGHQIYFDGITLL